MVSGTGLTATLPLPGESRPPLLVRLDGAIEHCALILNAFMRRLPKQLEGPNLHAHMYEFLLCAPPSEGELQAWIETSFVRTVNTRTWDGCRRLAGKWREEGIRVFGWTSSDATGPAGGVNDRNECGLSADGRLPCPAVLFCKGALDFDLPWLAVFNSRKPRCISPDADWLRALRLCLGHFGFGKTLFATSFGTLTHDMVAAYAHRAGLPLVVVTPRHLLSSFSKISGLHDGPPPSTVPVLSCLLDTGTCAKNKVLICRDQILAAAAHAHLVIEVRLKGNLSSVLEKQQTRSPRPQILFEPGKWNSSNSGNLTLIKRFPQHSHGFGLPVIRSTHPPALSQAHGRLSRGIFEKPEWDRYLFHYTRSCPGPWPGETYREYLLNLFDGDPLSGHSALDTLIRTVRERRIRAASRLIRGQEDVISWSSRPPTDIFILRRWNSALIRWTVEPYGIAVRRDLLRSFGAKPAIYGRQEDYSKLPLSEKYRFQLGQGLHTSWKHEREWRLRGDLALGKLNTADCFIFVPTYDDERRLAALAAPDLPLVSLER
ncbi:MAG: hypothetical protein AB9866_10275 [Syntrophobacteraceae bacterium]